MSALVYASLLKMNNFAAATAPLPASRTVREHPPPRHLISGVGLSGVRLITGLLDFAREHDLMRNQFEGEITTGAF